MSRKTTGWDELHLAESPAVELLQSLGFTYVGPEDIEPERPSLKEPILTNRLAEAKETLATPPPPTASRGRRTAVPDGKESSK